MRRRELEEETVNHERWVISYADFITLLFAFFVVMYSISSVNDGKYRVLSDSLVDAFQSASRTINPVSIGEKVATSGNFETAVELPVPGDFPSKEDYKYSVEGLFDDVEPGAARQGDHQDQQTSALSKLSEEMASRLQVEIQNADVKVVQRSEWLEVSIPSNVLFASASANLSADAARLLGKISEVLKPADYSVQVEGFTDNVPIRTEQFPSNWELSAARAAAVVRLFVLGGVNPARLAAIGYADQRALGDNATAEGRALNRRINIIVSTSKNQAEASPQEPSSAQQNGAPKDRTDYKIDRADRSETPTPDSTVEPMQSTNPAPLKIMTLEEGRVLFGAQPSQSGSSASQSGASASQVQQ
ncbi:Flagellar motor protein MotB [gamma proteobacterium HdN1]|nr:Flagellar motor protein MotB [gamma proteobacterium HdN1]